MGKMICLSVTAWSWFVPAYLSSALLLLRLGKELLVQLGVREQGKVGMIRKQEQGDGSTVPTTFNLRAATAASLNFTASTYRRQSPAGFSPHNSTGFLFWFRMFKHSNTKRRGVCYLKQVFSLQLSFQFVKPTSRLYSPNSN